MNLTVLRPEDGEMMQLVQYELAEWSVTNGEVIEMENMSGGVVPTPDPILP
jgi:hypothetical protein